VDPAAPAGVPYSQEILSDDDDQERDPYLDYHSAEVTRAAEKDLYFGGEILRSTDKLQADSGEVHCAPTIRRISFSRILGTKRTKTSDKEPESKESPSQVLRAEPPPSFAGRKIGGAKNFLDKSLPMYPVSPEEGLGKGREDTRSGAADAPTG